MDSVEKELSRLAEAVRKRDSLPEGEPPLEKRARGDFLVGMIEEKLSKLYLFVVLEEAEKRLSGESEGGEKISELRWYFNQLKSLRDRISSDSVSEEDLNRAIGLLKAPRPSG